MLGNLKDLYALQSKAKKIKKDLDSQEISSEKNGVTVVMTGSQEVINVTLNPKLSQQDQQIAVANAFNDCNRKIQSLMAKQMMGM